MDSFEIVSKVIPVFLLFIVGYVFRRTGFLSSQTAVQLKKLAANITLPALLLRSFMSMEPGTEEIMMALMMFILCLFLLLGVIAVFRMMGKRDDIRTYLMGGFEAGMLGYALFLSIFGEVALPVFASVDLGQVLFVLIIQVPRLMARVESSGIDTGKSGGTILAGRIRKAFHIVVTSPIVWSIFGGLLLGIISRQFSIPSRPFEPVAGFLEMLGNLTVPIIALAIGFELTFDRSIFGKAILFVGIRKLLSFGIALLLIPFLPIHHELAPIAFMMMLLLPPPFVVTLAAKDDEQSMVSGILSLSTVISVPLIAVAVLVMGN